MIDSNLETRCGFTIRKYNIETLENIKDRYIGIYFSEDIKPKEAYQMIQDKIPQIAEFYKNIIDLKYTDIINYFNLTIYKKSEEKAEKALINILSYAISGYKKDDDGLIKKSEMRKLKQLKRSYHGKINGELTKVLGLGYHAQSVEEINKWAKVGGETSRDQKKGFHAGSNEEKLAWAINAGKISYQRRMENLNFNSNICSN